MCVREREREYLLVRLFQIPKLLGNPAAAPERKRENVYDRVQGERAREKGNEKEERERKKRGGESKRGSERHL